ncbi:UNVERIFIED_CONTAM: hypothetical protein GTU68_012759 [Idotea baltica]|nr:hypothetical protein [Idotea baltica]
MKFIAIANQKGGVGKTTTAVNLGACLAERGVRTLILDLDPQANSTSSFGYSPDADIADLVLSTQYPNLSLIPSEQDLAGCEIEMAAEGDRLIRLKGILEEFRNSNVADYVFMDCPPSLGVMMTSALAAADELLIPLQCEYFGLEGVAKIVDLHEQIRNSGADLNVILEGIVFTMADSRTNLSTSVINDVRGVFGDVTYETIIPRNIRLSEAPSFSQTILEYAPSSAGAGAYRQLAEEFLKRHEAAAVEVDS